MDKKLQTTITIVVAILLVAGGVFFGISQAKKGAKCPFCSSKAFCKSDLDRNWHEQVNRP